MTTRQEWQGLCRGPSRVSRTLGTGSFSFSPPGLMADFWGQVQLEVQKKWRQWHLHEIPLRPVALSSSFNNGTSSLTNSTKGSLSGPSQCTCRTST